MEWKREMENSQEQGGMGEAQRRFGAEIADNGVKLQKEMDALLANGQNVGNFGSAAMFGGGNYGGPLTNSGGGFGGSEVNNGSVEMNGWGGNGAGYERGIGEAQVNREMNGGFNAPRHDFNGNVMAGGAMESMPEFMGIGNANMGVVKNTETEVNTGFSDKIDRISSNGRINESEVKMIKEEVDRMSDPSQIVEFRKGLMGKMLGR